jgi:hypothetical protein
MNTENDPLGSYFLRYTFLATPYATLVSVAYLWGYWNSFRINIFSFIALSDILKLALVPFLITTIVPAVGYIPTFLLYSWITKTYRFSSVPPPRLILTMKLIFTGGVILILFLAKGSSRWFWLGTLFVAVGRATISRVVVGINASKKFLEDENFRFAVVLLIIAPLLLALAFGRSRAERIFAGTAGTQFVETRLFRDFENQSFVKQELPKAHEKLKFVGAANDYLFFLSLDNSKMYITKFSDVHFLYFSL